MIERLILFGSDLPTLDDQLKKGDYIQFFYSPPYTMNGDTYQVQGTFRGIDKKKRIVIKRNFFEIVFEWDILIKPLKLVKPFKHAYEQDRVSRLAVLE